MPEKNITDPLVDHISCVRTWGSAADVAAALEHIRMRLVCLEEFAKPCLEGGEHVWHTGGLGSVYCAKCNAIRLGSPQ